MLKVSIGGGLKIWANGAHDKFSEIKDLWMKNKITIEQMQRQYKTLCKQIFAESKIDGHKIKHSLLCTVLESRFVF